MSTDSLFTYKWSIFYDVCSSLFSDKEIGNNFKAFSIHHTKEIRFIRLESILKTDVLIFIGRIKNVITKC